MKYSASFSDRSFQPARMPDALEIQPTRWSKKDIGGPDIATFIARGPESALWTLTSWLRYDAQITRSDGKRVWWGYISSISIRVGALTLKYSLDDMTNHVRVSYTARLEDDTKENRLTDWSTDTFSYNYYGAYKDLTIRGGDLSDDAAIALRDDTLESFKNFAASFEVGSGDSVSATIECRGYWNTLGWRQLTIATPNRDYYTPNQYGPYGYGLTYYPWGFQNGAQGNLSCGLGSNDSQGMEAVGIPFNLSTGGGVSAQQVKRFELMMYRQGTPGFTITAELWSDSGGNPGTLIGEVGTKYTPAIADTSSGPSPWIAFDHTVTKPVWLIPGVTYEAVMRTGNWSFDCMMMVGLTTGYAGGPAHRRQNGLPAWNAVSQPPWAPNFKLTTEHSESTVEVGATTARQIPAQGFQVSGSRDVSISTVQLRMCLGNSPTDDVVMTIHADSAGDPGTLLATSTAVPCTDVPDVFDDVVFTFPTPYLLSPGVQYWFKITRSGSISSSNFFIVAASLDVSANVYGICKLYNGSAWVAVTPVVDILFKINFTQETTQSILESIADVGAMLIGTDIADTSGVYQNPASDGETNALEVIEKLMKAGTLNGRRILSEVDASRRVRLYEAPASSDGAAVYINRLGQVVSQYGEVLSDYCPVGVWVSPIDVVRGGALAPAGATPLFYLEGMDYNPINGSVSPRLKGQRDPFDLNGVK